jgi:hypothetical protein
MPSAFRTPKNLAEWLRLDYFRYPRRLPRLRRALGWAALLLCVGGLCAAAFLKREAALYQAGPLSTAHAELKNDCGQCHQEKFATAQRFLPWQQSVTSVPDAACKKCHDGPLHNNKLLATDHCASCHQEHRGLASLARLPDARCLSCHRDLKANTRDGQTVYADIHDFPDGHVEFRGLGNDPGNIKFNHWVHVNLNPDSLARLDCAACHQNDEAGRYMQPIKYESHCKTCHPLSVQLGGEFGKNLETAANAFAKEPAPHTTPNIVRAVLRDRLLKFVADNPLQARDDADQRGKPGPKANLETDLPKVRWAVSLSMTNADRFAFVQAQLGLSEQLCFDRAGGCVLCHVEPKSHMLGELPEYAKSNLPNRWFPHSRFDHRAHRMMNCTECHAVTAQSIQASDVMMPGRASCAQCHSPRAGARHDCLECHMYHPRDHGLEAPGQHLSADRLEK